ncbi:MAG: hypothetical protein ACJ76H_13715 [Bacteriovoracaceae bacterium]
MKSFLFLFMIFFSLSGYALETDNYFVWNKELRDSSSYIDRYFEEKISEALTTITSPETKTCEQVTIEIAHNFASHLVHDNPVENWLFSVLSAEEIIPATLNWVEESIYREPYMFYIPWFGLAPNIQVNGFYFGTDKLSHFASTGMIYYKIFQRELSKTKNTDLALKAAIDWGVRDEKSVHGFWASGVFSFADLESNYQGLRFYRNFCEGNSPYLQKKPSGHWSLSNKPAIKDFVSGLWDESFNLSYRLPDNWEKVKSAISAYCELSHSPEVKERMKYYSQKIPVSFSQNYLEDLKTSGGAPSPEPSQSFVGLCRNFRL